MTLPRFFAPDLTADRAFLLPEEEGHHLTRVLRLREGDEVAVFDGRGAEYRARIESARRDHVSLRVTERLPAPLPPRVAVTVVQAVLKGSSMDEVIRDATMMGAARIVPVLTEHVDVKPSVVARDSVLERWQRVSLASVKQCRRADLPVIEPARSFSEALGMVDDEVRLIFIEPSLETRAVPLRDALPKVPPRAAVLIGPEGGWSSAEVAAALAAGCRPVSLGTLTIRAESMAVVALAAITALTTA